MKYYRIRHTLNSKILGNYPQVKEVKHNCHINDEPNFIQHYQIEKIDFEPFVSNPILFDKSIKTDLIERLGVGFSHRLVISSKLYNLLKKENINDFQYFICSIFHKGIEDENYWIMNVNNTRQEFIDFSKSEILLRSRKPEGGTTLTSVNMSNLDDFNISKELNKKNRAFLSLNKIELKNEIEDDFFALSDIEGGIGYFVSEKLKNIIKESECTGIEFQPIHLTFNEWTSKGGEREKVYGKV